MVMFFGEVFLCVPIDTLWTNILAMPEKCMYYSTFFVIMMATELALDVVLLALPISQMLKLSMAWEKKCMVSVIFLLGGL